MKKVKPWMILLIILFVIIILNNSEHPDKSRSSDIVYKLNKTGRVKTPLGSVTCNGKYLFSEPAHTMFRYCRVIKVQNGLYIRAHYTTSSDDSVFRNDTDYIDIIIKTHDKLCPISGKFKFYKLTDDDKINGNTTDFLGFIKMSELKPSVFNIIHNMNEGEIYTNGTIYFNKIRLEQYCKPENNMLPLGSAPFTGGFIPDIDCEFKDIIDVPGGTLVRKSNIYGLLNNTPRMYKEMRENSTATNRGFIVPAVIKAQKYVTAPSTSEIYPTSYNPSIYTFIPNYKNTSLPDGFLITYNPDGILLHLERGNPIITCIKANCCPPGSGIISASIKFVVETGNNEFEVSRDLNDIQSKDKTYKYNIFADTLTNLDGCQLLEAIPSASVRWAERKYDEHLGFVTWFPRDKDNFLTSTSTYGGAITENCWETCLRQLFYGFEQDTPTH